MENSVLLLKKEIVVEEIFILKIVMALMYMGMELTSFIPLIKKYGNQLSTVITKEYPKEWKWGDEPYYPVNDKKINCFLINIES